MEKLNLKQSLEKYQTLVASGLQYQADQVMHNLFDKKANKEKFEFIHKDIRRIFFGVQKRLLTGNKAKVTEDDYDEFQSMFNVTLFDLLVNNAKPFDKDNAQIVDWAKKRCHGMMVNQYNESDTVENHEFVVSEAILQEATEDNKGFTEDEITLYDQYVFEQFKVLDDFSPYKEFLDSVGGIEKLVTPDQLKIIEYKCSDMKQVDIAKELGLTERQVSDELLKAYKKIKKEYMYHRSVSMLLETSVYQDIVQFIEFYNMVLDCEGNDFDYYTFLLKFLKKHYSKGEQYIKSETLHRNKPISGITVFDIVTDGKIHRDSWKVLYDTLEGESPKGIKTRQKNNIVKQVIDIFEQYISDTDKLIRKINLNINNDKLGA